ncbi:TetR/AcrR family transcriptional regulator [Myxococcota bacterium]|nr:TetR/AcrR family transcriptional regulator [Myxococcota bacterium]
MAPPAAAARRPSPDRGQAEAILTAAEGCFSRSGYAGASMREIAEAAGVSKGLLHYHFKSKEQLFVEVQIRAYERLSTRVRAAVAPIPGGKDRGLAALDALVSALRESNDIGVQAELWAAALSDRALRTHVVRLREFFRDLLVRSISEILGPDVARLGLTAEGVADLLWAVLNGTGVELAFGAPPGRADNSLGAFRVLAGVALDASEGQRADPSSPTTRAPTAPWR